MQANLFVRNGNRRSLEGVAVRAGDCIPGGPRNSGVYRHHGETTCHGDCCISSQRCSGCIGRGKKKSNVHETSIYYDRKGGHVWATPTETSFLAFPPSSRLWLGTWQPWRLLRRLSRWMTSRQESGVAMSSLLQAEDIAAHDCGELGGGIILAIETFRHGAFVPDGTRRTAMFLLCSLTCGTRCTDVQCSLSFPRPGGRKALDNYRRGSWYDLRVILVF
jgi:hypothetical protein